MQLKYSKRMNFVKRLLEGRSRHEDQIRQDIGRMLDELGIHNILSYKTPAGAADIYLPRRRVFIETKAVGLADNPHADQGRENNETPFDQVKRYLIAERNDELGSLFASEQHGGPWTGVVTDGRIWHAWRFPHTHQTKATCVLPGVRPQNKEELLQRITPIVNVEPIGKPWIPSDPVQLFKRYLTDLKEVYGKIAARRVRKTTETKKHLWLDILRGSGMAPESPYAQDSLFITHCFLVTLARGVVHTVSRPDDPPKSSELLRDGYLAWIIEIEPGREWAQKLLDRVHSYEWRRTAGDVLRPLYEGLVERSDRRDFGEVYTPDWLAEMMVAEVLDEDWCDQAVNAALAVSHGQPMPKGMGVLDPTCGSGTFLYHCAKRILTSPTAKELQPGQRSDVVCRLVHGIDIHPVAVEFARATLLRALPTLPSMGLTSMAIFQGDSLMLRQTDENSLFAPKNGEVVIRSPRGNEVLIPREFTDHHGFAGMLPRIVESAMRGDPVPPDIGMALKDVEAEIVELHKALTTIINEEGNSVWAWYIQNILGPDRLARRKVDRIVANPPWVKLSNIQVQDRKREIESAAGKDQKGDALWGGGNQAPHFDIAQLFIHLARSYYLNQPKTDPAAWVTKASAIRGGNWNKFRKMHKEYISQSLDFSSAKVFGGGDARRSCVIFEIRRSSLGNSEKLKAECVGPTPEASMSWEEAQSLLDWKEPIPFPVDKSGYIAKSWRQGATITPKVLTTVKTNNIGSKPGTRYVETAKSDKGKWKRVSTKSGELPAKWLVPVLNSGQLLPFLTTELRTAIVPLRADGDILHAEMARENRFWRMLDDLYQEHRGLGTNTPRDLLSQINYANKLSAQLPLHPSTEYMVVYPASGDIMRAACIQVGTAVMDSKVYWRRMESRSEARYLVAVLNTPCLEKAFRDARTSGRDFHKSPWKNVPIPTYDEGSDIHRELSEWGEKAERTVKSMNLPTGQRAASNRIRKRLAEDGAFSEINKLVNEILPHHVTN